MKKTFFILALTLGLCTSTLMAQNDLDSALVVTEIADGSADEDSVKSNTWTFNNGVFTFDIDSLDVVNDWDDWDELGAFFENLFDGHFDLPKFEGVMKKFGWLIALIPILIFFVLPVLIILIIALTVYKGRKAKYRAYEKMAEKGQEIPQSLQEEMDPNDVKTRNDAVRTICVGVGLFILLGVIMDSFGRAIGALVFCIGVGKYLVYWLGQRDKKR